MERSDGERNGANRGCLYDGCLAVLVLLLVCVVDRDGREVTVTAEVVGVGPEAGFMADWTLVKGCFAFDVRLGGPRQPAVTVREPGARGGVRSACGVPGAPPSGIAPSG